MKAFPLASICLLLASFVLAQDTPPWPASVPLPQNLQAYHRAKYTQSIYTTSGFTQHFIDPVPRLKLEKKWHQSGGMENVSGYRSDVYKVVPGAVKVWVGEIDVLNGLGHYQKNRGWKRLYPDGTEFHDVLSYKGAVFEHRRRQKEKGRWKSEILFRDEAARPARYTGLTQSCASCHDAAGTGGYAVGLVPGGDGVLSDPFPALEVRPWEIKK